MVEQSSTNNHEVKGLNLANDCAVPGAYTIRIHNVRQMDRFGSKLVSFIFSVTNTLAFYGIQ